MMCLRHDSEGESGVGYVVRLVVCLLDPTRPESTAVFVGRLIIIFIKRVSSAQLKSEILWHTCTGRCSTGRSSAALVEVSTE